jgi:hypothetical protein
MGRTTVCGTVSSLFKSGYPPAIYNKSQDSSIGRTLISCINSGNSNFSPGTY